MMTFLKGVSERWIMLVCLALHTVAFTIERDPTHKAHRGGQWVEDMVPEKRRSLSLNQDLVSVADMMRGNAADDTHARLMAIGKRVPSHGLNRDPSEAADDVHHKLGKRVPLAINQDLQSVADMMRGDSHDKLLALGKRAPSLSLNQDLQSVADMMRGDSHDRLLALGKRAPSLSLNQDLQSVADMMRGNSHSRLLNLGKRSISSAENEDDMSLADLERTWLGREPVPAHRRHLGKRSPELSVNQDLQQLSGMLREQRRKQAQGHLSRIGKR